MASNETNAPTRPRGFDPRRATRWAKFATMVIGVLACGWFVTKFTTRWVPAGMNTNDAMPPGSWLVLDRWSSGLRVGSDVLVTTPHGELLSRISAIDGERIEIRHPSDRATWGDSTLFGPLPRQNVIGTVVVAFGGGGEGGREDGK